MRRLKVFNSTSIVSQPFLNRLMSMQNRHSYEFGPFNIDTLNRQLLRDGEVVPLKAKAVDTLLLLIEGRGDVVEKDDLMKSLWPDSYVEEANLTQYIYTLRKALGEGNYIETIPRRGYRFVAEVEESRPADRDFLVIKERTRTSVSYEEQANDVSSDLVRESDAPPVHAIAVRAHETLPAAKVSPSTFSRYWWVILVAVTVIATTVF